MISPLNVNWPRGTLAPARSMRKRRKSIPALKVWTPLRPGHAVDELPGFADIEVRQQVAVAHREIAGDGHRHVAGLERVQRAIDWAEGPRGYPVSPTDSGLKSVFVRRLLRRIQFRLNPSFASLISVGLKM